MDLSLFPHLHTPVRIVSEQASTPGRRNRAVSRRPALRTMAVAAVGATVFLAGASICLIVKSGRPAGTVTLDVPGSSGRPAAPKPNPDERLRRLAVGTWRDFYQGKRTLTLHPDGTATMVVELTGYKARLFTPRLELDIAWSIEDGKMHRRTVGGRPANRVAFVNKRAGVAVAEQILALAEDRMILLDRNGSRKYTWRRVTQNPDSR